MYFLGSFHIYYVFIEKIHSTDHKLSNYNGAGMMGFYSMHMLIFMFLLSVGHDWQKYVFLSTSCLMYNNINKKK